MDFLKNAAGSLGQGQGQNQQQGGAQPSSNAPNPTDGQVQGQSQQQSSGGIGGFFSGLQNKANEAAGGGKESEKNEDYLDKGVDFVQEKFLGQGAQDNESAVEQAKDEQISDFIRGKYKSTTGKDFFVADKATALDKSTD